MSTADPLAPLRPHIRNTLPAVSVPWVAGVLGDHPSQYSRSPAMWNAAFAALGLPAAYVSFDVALEHLEAFVAACRPASGLLGFNVTVPYKERVLPYLDSLLGDARSIGAVNTIVRTPGGSLDGANTDGAAALAVLRRLSPDLPEWPRALLLLGAGGAARAVGLAAAELSGAAIYLCNRRVERAEAAARTIRQGGGAVTVVLSDELDGVLPDADVLVNATTVGMAGPIRTDRGVTWLEPFSPLAPADPPSLPASAADDETPPAEWRESTWPGVVRNLEVSLRRALRLRPGAAVLDLIYAPPETVLLKHARWTGHTAVNGLEVLVGQAVEAFMRIGQPLFHEGEAGLRPKVTRAMSGVLK